MIEIDLEGLAEVWNNNQSVFEQIFWKMKGYDMTLLVGEFYVKLIRGFEDEENQS